VLCFPIYRRVDTVEMLDSLESVASHFMDILEVDPGFSFAICTRIAGALGPKKAIFPLLRYSTIMRMRWRAWRKMNYPIKPWPLFMTGPAMARWRRLGGEILLAIIVVSSAWGIWHICRFPAAKRP